MDLQAALEFLSEQACSAATVQLLHAPGDSGRWALVGRDGKAEWRDRECGRRHHNAHSFDSFIRETIGIHPTTSGETWVFVPQGELIVAIVGVDKSDRPRDSVSMPVDITDEFKFLSKDPTSFDQKGLIRVLRVDLHRCAVDELIELLTHVTFSYTEDGESAITTGKTSLSRKTVNELRSQGDGDELRDLPEIVNLKCHYLEQTTRTMPISPDVDCLLAVDPGKDKPFSLVPLGGETANVIDQTQEWIVEHLTKAFADTEGIHVFTGEA